MEAISVIGSADVLVAKITSADAFQFLPNALFDLHVFQYGFNYQIHIFELVQRSSRLQLVSQQVVQIGLGHG